MTATSLKSTASMLFVGGLYLATSALAAAPAHATSDGDVARGEAAYEQNCASCHANPARIMGRVAGATDEEKAARLEAFLPDHYAEDPQERAEIIAYMLSL
jgi:mono/diheme cytochrome c family protein